MRAVRSTVKFIAAQENLLSYEQKTVRTTGILQEVAIGTIKRTLNKKVSINFQKKKKRLIAGIFKKDQLKNCEILKTINYLIFGKFKGKSDELSEKTS